MNATMITAQNGNRKSFWGGNAELQDVSKARRDQGNDSLEWIKGCLQTRRLPGGISDRGSLTS